MIRDWVSVKIARHLNLKEKSNWNAAALQNVKTCICDRGDMKQMKKQANFAKLKKVLPSKKCARKE